MRRLTWKSLELNVVVIKKLGNFLPAFGKQLAAGKHPGSFLLRCRRSQSFENVLTACAAKAFCAFAKPRGIVIDQRQKQRMRFFMVCTFATDEREGIGAIGFTKAMAEALASAGTRLWNSVAILDFSRNPLPEGEGRMSRSMSAKAISPARKKFSYDRGCLTSVSRPGTIFSSVQQSPLIMIFQLLGLYSERG